ncbi:SAM-dependent methyltransferase [Catenulispora sp. MAP5-51]|uniref:class I SAM-dependent methyltransferase n=1 Tax=Catenulispora sp. MAP5-51 TaxID=3156298 RepID=UPI003516E730
MTELGSADTVYTSSAYRTIDVGSLMRTGHPDIAEGDEHIVSVVRAMRARLGRPLRVLDVGSGSGDLSLLLVQALPDTAVIANDIAANPLAQARDKLAPYPTASVSSERFEDFSGEVDVVVSWGTHHHLSHDYLSHVAEILSPDGVLIIGDEFCPEYLSDTDQKRLAQSEEISVVDGYLFDSAADVESYRSTGLVPDWNEGLEQARRLALWHWYKFVIDFAVAHEAWTVVMAELAICRDDLETGNHDEHKTSPYLLERELELNGFSVAERAVIGDRPVELSSFVLYTCRPPRAGR